MLPKEENALRFDYLNSLSTPQLEDILRMDAEDLDSDNEGVVFAVLSILQEREKENPAKEPVDVAAAWQRFQKYYNTSDGMDDSLYAVSFGEDAPAKEKNRRKGSGKGIVWRVVAMVAMLCVVFTLVTPAFGMENIFTMLAQWKDSLFSFVYQSKMLNDPAVSYEFSTENPDLQRIYDTVTEMGVSSPVVPMWIPDGFALATLEDSGTQADHRLCAVFCNNADTIVVLVETSTNNNNGVYYIDKGTAETVEIGDVTHYIMPNNDKWLAAWTTDNLICTISTDLGRDDLLSILKSVYMKG